MDGDEAGEDFVVHGVRGRGDDDGFVLGIGVGLEVLQDICGSVLVNRRARARDIPADFRVARCEEMQALALAVGDMVFVETLPGLGVADDQEAAVLAGARGG